MASRLNGLMLCLIAGVCIPAVALGEIQPAHAHEIEARADSEHVVSGGREIVENAADANALAPSQTSNDPRPAQAARRAGSGLAKGPYYVDFRSRTAASWGHAFVWYGRTGDRKFDVAGLTPAGDTLQYVLGYVTSVPSETGASYGDLDPQYLTASYRVYLNDSDARRVFAYIKRLQATSRVWNAEIANCNSFIGSIAEFMGLKVPSRWIRPVNYIKSLKAMNGDRPMVHLSSVQ